MEMSRVGAMLEPNVYKAPLSPDAQFSESSRHGPETSSSARNTIRRTCFSVGLRIAFLSGLIVFRSTQTSGARSYLEPANHFGGNHANILESNPGGTDNFLHFIDRSFARYHGNGQYSAGERGIHGYCRWRRWEHGRRITSLHSDHRRSHFGC